ncbi:multidrug transporter, partial [Mesorhizobium sp. M4A.F.Ca.ET.090.04.2.1]
MTVQLLFYQDAKPVTSDRHRDVSIKTGHSYAFARNVNSVPVTAVEFAQAAAEYPIVFAGTEQSIMPAVILGVKQTENLYVDDAGNWSGKYVPAFVRRYPFVFSSDASGRTFILNIDESFEGINREGRGERLFDADGQQTRYLKEVLGFLQDYQSRFQRTKRYCDLLKSLGLLQPMQAQFNLNSGERRSLAGFMTVDRQKLKAIDAADLQTMFGNDELECTYLHLHS